MLYLMILGLLVLSACQIRTNIEQRNAITEYTQTSFAYVPSGEVCETLRLDKFSNCTIVIAEPAPNSKCVGDLTITSADCHKCTFNCK